MEVLLVVEMTVESAILSFSAATEVQANILRLARRQGEIKLPSQTKIFLHVPADHENDVLRVSLHRASCGELTRFLFLRCYLSSYNSISLVLSYYDSDYDYSD